MPGWSRASKLHDERTKLGRCMYDRRDTGGEEHGPIYKAKRCKACYEKALKSNRDNAALKRAGIPKLCGCGARRVLTAKFCSNCGVAFGELPAPLPVAKIVTRRKKAA